MSILDPCKICNTGQIEWADQYCPDCWEDLCNREWWLMIAALEAEEGATDA